MHEKWKEFLDISKQYQNEPYISRQGGISLDFSTSLISPEKANKKCVSDEWSWKSRVFAVYQIM